MSNTLLELRIASPCRSASSAWTGEFLGVFGDASPTKEADFAFLKAAIPTEWRLDNSAIHTDINYGTYDAEFKAQSGYCQKTYELSLEQLVLKSTGDIDTTITAETLATDQDIYISTNDDNSSTNLIFNPSFETVLGSYTMRLDINFAFVDSVSTLLTKQLLFKVGNICKPNAVTFNAASMPSGGQTAEQDKVCPLGADYCPNSTLTDPFNLTELNVPPSHTAFYESSNMYFDWNWDINDNV